MCHASCISFGSRLIKKEEVTGKKVLEVGSKNVNGSLRDYVIAFNPSQYIGIDIAPGPGVDKICDVNNIVATFGANSFDLVICTEVMEHVINWRSALSNLKNVLTPGGVIILTTRSIGFPYHSYPHDLWRFQPADMHVAFSDFTIETIEKDSQCPGVFIKAAKPVNFVEKNLANYQVYRMKIKVAVIACVNNQAEYKKSLKYISALNIDGIDLEIIKITNAKSMAAGYNQGMRGSNAKYKIYMHQDTYILNRNFIHDCLKLFNKYPKLGMLGVIGGKGNNRAGAWWNMPDNYGYIIYGRTGMPLGHKNPVGDMEPVALIDGLMIVTQYDIPWREDIFTGFHFYDASQCMEFRKRGLWVGVPRQSSAWCYHTGKMRVDKSFTILRRRFIRYYYGRRAKKIKLVKSKSKLTTSKKLLPKARLLVAKKPATSAKIVSFKVKGRLTSIISKGLTKKTIKLRERLKGKVKRG